MFQSQIVRLSSGVINKVNDTVIGGMAGITGISKFAGQLGQGFFMDDSNVLFDSTIGTVFGGHFRYVRLAVGATQPAFRGQLVFWDDSVADNLYQVTTAEAGTVPATKKAGIVLNPTWTPGNYSVVQDIGKVAVRFRAVLSSAAQTGAQVIAAGAGAGADLGTADLMNTADPATFGDMGLMIGRYLGTAAELPVAGAASLVYINFGMQSPKL